MAAGNAAIVVPGEQFGRLVILDEPSPDRSQDGRLMVMTRCTCGTVKAVRFRNIKRGHTRSCGCLRKEIAQRNVTHGEARRGRCTPEYVSWWGMLQRCSNTSRADWKDYGGRGITVEDPRWFVFENFLADMGRRPGRGFSIERLDNSLGYSPANCAWATRSEQAGNRRPRTLKTRCAHGHLLSIHAAVNRHGHRVCRLCRRDHAARRWYGRWIARGRPVTTLET